MRYLALIFIGLLSVACTDHTSAEEKAAAEQAKIEILQEEEEAARKVEEARIALEDSIKAMMDTVPMVQ